jgi:hypothetical protein
VASMVCSIVEEEDFDLTFCGGCCCKDDFSVRLVCNRGDFGGMHGLNEAVQRKKR